MNTAGAGSRLGSSTGRGDRHDRKRARVGGQGGNHNDPGSLFVSEDPVRLGLVASLARPGGNTTGMNYLIAEVTAKRLELLRVLVPGALETAVLVNPEAPVTETVLRELEDAATATGLRLECSKPPPAAKSMRRLQPLCTTGPTRSSSLVILFQQPTGSVGPLCDALRGPHDLRRPRICRGRRAYELRGKPYKVPATTRPLCGPDSQRRKTCGPACHPVDQTRTSHQRRNRRDARPGSATRLCSPAPTR